MMEKVFQAAAVVLGIGAAYFVWEGNKDAAFISIVLGCVAFFLSVRTQVKDRNRLRQEKAESEASTQGD